MAFPFALSRMILLRKLTVFQSNRLLTVPVFIVVTNVISSVLSVFAFHERTGGGKFQRRDTYMPENMTQHTRIGFQILVLCFGVLSLLTVIGW